MWSYRFKMLRQRVGPPPTVADRNAWYLSLEVAFASILSAAAAFNSTYVIRLGASNTVIGLMSSIPSLEAMLLYIPMAAFLEGRKHYMPWMVWSLFASRIVYLFIAFLPLLLFKGLGNVTAALLIFATVPSVLFSVAWNPMFSDVVPARTRASVVSVRSILSSAVVAPLIYLAGLWLDSRQDSFPRNYQWLFLVGFIGGAISVYLVSRIRTPEKAVPLKTEKRKATLHDMLGLSMLKRSPQFARLTVNTFLVSAGSWMVGPLYTILYVRQLGASDSWIGATSTLSNIGAVAGYWIGQRIVKKIGENRGLRFTVPVNITWPLLVAIVSSLTTAKVSLTIVLIGGFLQNVISPLWSLSHTMIWMSRLPDEGKMTATAVYNTIMNVGAFILPLVGVALSDVIGIPGTLLIGAAMNAVGVLMFYVHPVSLRVEEPEPEVEPQGA